MTVTWSCLSVCVGDVVGVVRASRDLVDESFAGLCAEMTSLGWLISPVLLAADEWRAHWTHQHQYPQQLLRDDDYKKLF